LQYSRKGDSYAAPPQNQQHQQQQRRQHQQGDNRDYLGYQKQDPLWQSDGALDEEDSNMFDGL